MSEADQKIQPHIIQKYQPYKKIGCGAYGVVWKVIQKKKKTIHALKKNFDAFQNSTDAQRTYRQIMFLKQLKHPNIIQLQKIIRSYNEKDVYLLFEYMQIDLYMLIRQNVLEQKHKRLIMYQIVKAMIYLHSGQLIHRDLKPSNILVNQDCIAKLCDFGLVRSVNTQEEEDTILTQYIATRWYRAPEILLGSKKYSKAVDVWSFGCLLAQIIRGKPMFPGNSTLNQIQRVLTWTGSPTLIDMKALKTDFGKQMLQILSKIKKVNRKDWFHDCDDDAYDLLKRTIEFNPKNRLTMEQIIKHPYFKEFYDQKSIIKPTNKIRIQINDNKKLTLKEYRQLIYNQIKQGVDESYRPSPLTSMGMSTGMSKCRQNNSAQKQKSLQNKTANKGRIYKQKEQKNNHRNNLLGKSNKNIVVSKDVSPMGQIIAKKYESVIGKRKQAGRSKPVKTEQRDDNSKINKYDYSRLFHSDKKKAISFHQGRRQSEVLAKYMYKHRYY